MSVSPAEEIFDVVDEFDNVIDQRPRAEVHRLGLRHRSTHLLVFNQAGQIFLQKRSMEKDENPGQWDSSVSGHVDSGESYDECVVREAREEIGLALADTPKRLFKFDADPDTGMEFCWIYSVQSEGPFELDPVEITAGRWYDPGELDRAVANSDSAFTPSIIAIWARFAATN